jgi:DNA-binding SARP family transcriptional activator/TolB-like protein/Tfp pilus assembly protein PilF
MYRLETLGCLVLRDGTGAPAATQRQRLALLALLAAAGERGLARDKLVALLWPESPAESARHALEQLLFTLRRRLGDRVFLGVDPLRLSPDAVASDLVEFRLALDRGDLATAIALYHGPFLDGFYLTGAEEFERWVEGERMMLRERYLAALEELAEAETARGNTGEAVQCWRKLAHADSLNVRGALGLMRALAAAGDRAGALQHARVYEALVRDQLELPPDPRITEFVARLREPPQGAPVAAAPDGARLADRPGGPEQLPGVSPRAGGVPVLGEATAEPASAGRPIEPARAAQPPSEAPRFARRWRGPGAAAALVVVLAGVGWVLRVLTAGGPASGSSRQSIVVLPLDFIGDPGGEYLADGLTDDLILSLSTQAAVTVEPRSSSFYYKGRGLDPQEVARRLGARYLVSGSLRKQGNRIRVVLSLVDAASGRQLWTDALEREHDDVLEVQVALAGEIAHSLGTAVAASEPPTHDRAAYDLYLRGRHAWNQRTPASLRAAIGFFEQALARDPGFAVGWAGLADAYSLSANFSDLPPSEFLPRARIAALRAAALDSNRAEVETALGIVATFSDRDWDRAERHFRRALQLNERYAPGHLFYAWYLVLRDSHAEALREILRARELEPLNLTINVRVGTMYGYLGRPREAIEPLRRALALEPRSPMARLELGWLYAYLGRFDSAFVEVPPLEAHLAGYHAGQLGQSLALAGRRAEALAVLDSLRQIARRRYVSAEAFAAIYAGLGENDLAFQELERAYQQQSFTLAFVGKNLVFAPLRSDPRFPAFVRRVLSPRP